MDTDEVVAAALATQVQRDVDEIRGGWETDLVALGLDSTGLIRALLEIERALGLAQPLEPDDAALATPATLAAAVAARVA